MRVWLVDDCKGAAPGGLELAVRQVAERPGCPLRLLGVSAFQADFLDSMRKLVPELLDLLIINERAWPEGPWLQDVLSLGLGVVLVTQWDRVEPYQQLATKFPLTFVAHPPSADSLWPAIVGAGAAVHREQQWKEQMTNLQQRLNDRVVIERAKGILVQRLKISEDDAYKRLRVLSRRQRRQIRDIAQSLLDTQFLFTPDGNGFAGELNEDQPQQKDDGS
jgi:hypothetical protein